MAEPDDTFVDASFFTETEEKKTTNENGIANLQNAFSPKQIGSIAKYIDPVSANSPIEALMNMFKEKEDLMAVPVEEYDHVVAVLDRKTVMAVTNTAWKRWTAKNVGDYIQRVSTILYAHDFIEKALSKVSEINREYGVLYFPVFYGKSFYGIVSLDGFLSRIAEIQEQDLQKASVIQQSFMPDELAKKQLPYRFTAWNKMANALGGDFYQVYRISDTKSMACCFDVSGKNVAASLLTITVGSFFKMMALVDSEEKDPVQIICKLDSYLETTVPSGNFITALICYIDLESNKMHIFNCGHTLTYLLYQEDPLSKHGKIGSIKPKLPPLGIGAVSAALSGLTVDSPDCKKSITSHSILKSMHLDIYTDGFTDMKNDDGFRFEDDAAKQFFIKLYEQKDEAVCPFIEHTVTNWIQHSMIPDDITVLDIRF